MCYGLSKMLRIPGGCSSKNAAGPRAEAMDSRSREQPGEGGRTEGERGEVWKSGERQKMLL